MTKSNEWNEMKINFVYIHCLNEDGGQDPPFPFGKIPKIHSKPSHVHCDNLARMYVWIFLFYTFVWLCSTFMILPSFAYLNISLIVQDFRCFNKQKSTHNRYITYTFTSIKFIHLFYWHLLNRFFYFVYARWFVFCLN